MEEAGGGNRRELGGRGVSVGPEVVHGDEYVEIIALGGTPVASGRARASSVDGVEMCVPALLR